jgi:hypothetical protein
MQSATEQNVLDNILKHHHRLPLQPMWRSAVHFLLIILGWLVYFWLVCHTLFNVAGDDVQLILWVILVSLIAVPLTTLIWIVLNVSLFKKTNRIHNPSIEEKYEQDWEGNTVHCDWARAKLAKKINIRIEQKAKHYFIEN